MTLSSLLSTVRNRVSESLAAAGPLSGFTMIELLVVIAVIGVLAVAVLSSINPIEQINKGRDTRTRSDAAQLINAVDRYYAIHEVYPWNTTTPTFTATVTQANQAYDFDGPTAGAADWNWIDVLVDTGEVKEGFTNRLKNDDTISVFKAGTNNATMYACFIPTSLAFKQEAMDNCNDGSTPQDTFGSVTPCPDGQAATLEGDNSICLP